MSGRNAGMFATAVSIVALVLMGCGAAGAGGDGPGAGSPMSGLGSSFMLPAGMIEDWDGDDGEEASVVLLDANGSVVHSYGPVVIDGGFFPGLQITTPPAGVLLTIGELSDELNVELQTSDPGARLQMFDEVTINRDSIFRQGDGVLVGWMYTDRNVAITAEDDTTFPGFTMIVDLNLVTGWNRILVDPDLNETTIGTGPEPAGARWVW